MKKIIILFLILVLFSCQSIDKKERNIQDQIKKSEKEVRFDFLSFQYSVNKSKSQLMENQLYQINYEISFLFENKNNRFTVDIKLYDPDNQLVFERQELKAEQAGKNRYLVKQEFADYFSYPVLRFYLAVHRENQIEEYTGEYVNSSLPHVDQMLIGPVITQMNEKNQINTTLFITSYIKNIQSIQWFRVIPPAQDAYWDIPWQYEKGEIVVNGPIVDNKHPNYIENGPYIIQINFGQSGNYQKEIILKDFFDNSRGPNYGLPMAAQKEVDKNFIHLELDLKEKIDYMEFHIYSEKNNALQKLGTAKMYALTELVPKKEFMKMFSDHLDNKIKLKYNEQYFYELYLYSKEYNQLKYISISKIYALKFKGFVFFNF